MSKKTRRPKMKTLREWDDNQKDWPEPIGWMIFLVKNQSPLGSLIVFIKKILREEYWSN